MTASCNSYPTSCIPVAQNKSDTNTGNNIACNTIPYTGYIRNAKQAIEKNFWSYSERDQATITDILGSIYANSPSYGTENAGTPFAQFSIPNTDDARETLRHYIKSLIVIQDPMVAHHPETKKLTHLAMQKIQEAIDDANNDETKQPIDRIAFFRDHNVFGMMDTKYGEAINESNNIDIYAEDGNGGYYTSIAQPGSCSPLLEIRVTEDRLKQRPNMICVFLKSNLRKKFNMLMYQHNAPNIHKYDTSVLNGIRNMTDLEVRETFEKPYAHIDYD